MKNKLHAFALFVALLAFNPFGLLGQNDNCNQLPDFKVNVSSTPICNIPLSGTTVGATQSMPGCVGIADDDVWYWFEATGTSHVVTVYENSLFNAVFEVFSGGCSWLTPIVCVDNNVNGGFERTTLTGLTIGNAYFMRIYGGNNNSGQGTFLVCVGTPPENDNCTFDVDFVVPVNTNTDCTNQLSGTSLFATETLTGCIGNADDDVWYRFVATENNLNVTVTPSNPNGGQTMEDVVLQVFSGNVNCGSLNSIACVNNTSGYNPETANLTGLSIGASYYMRVHSFLNYGHGGFTFCIVPVTPGNDNCSTAQPLTVNPEPLCSTQTAGTTVASTQSLAGCTGAADDDVWYSFQATSATHLVSVAPSLTPSINNAVFQVFSGSCGSPTSIACVNNTTGGGTETTTLTNLTIGNTYFVRVYSFDSGIAHQGKFNICVSSPPTNDNCSSAHVVAVNSGGTCSSTLNGSTQLATQSMVGCTGTADDDVWYRFVAAATGQVVAIAPVGSASLNDAVFEVFSGTCGSLTSIVCVNNTTGGGTESTILNSLTIGDTYFVRVYSFSGNAVDQGQFNICVTSLISNDNCSSAIMVTVNSDLTCGSTLNGTTLSTTQSMTGCTGTADDDVWYQFIATATGHSIKIEPITPPSLINPVFEVFSGSCGSLTSIACVDDSPYPLGIELRTFNGLTIGNTYFVRVYSFSGNVGDQGGFNICIRTTPANDNCNLDPEFKVEAFPNNFDCNFLFSGTSLLASQSLPGCTGIADDDVWHWFTATSTSYWIKVGPYGTTDMDDVVFEVFSGSCGSLTSIACVNNNVLYEETTALTGLTIGSNYFIRVYSSASFSNHQGGYYICMTDPIPNDNCNILPAHEVIVNNAPFCAGQLDGGTNDNFATQSLPSCAAGGNADDDLWYHFTATATSHVVSVGSYTMENVVFEVFSGTSCSSLTSIACVNSTTGGNTETTTLTSLTVGAKYYIRVYSFGLYDYGFFSVCVYLPPLANEDCNTLPAYNVPVNTGLTCSSTLAGSSLGASQTMAECFTGSATQNDVWFSFQATATSHVVTITPLAPNPIFDIVFQVFEGSCTTLGSGSIACVNNTTDDSPETTTLTDLVAGDTYYLRVYSHPDNGSWGQFTTCITTPLANDNCNTLPAYVVPLNTGLSCTNTLAGTSIGGTQSMATCASGGDADDDVWFSFQAAATSHVLSVTPSGATPISDVVFQVFSGACGSLVPIACVNSTVGGNPEITTLTGLTIGNTYQMRVYSFGGAVNAGQFTICNAILLANDNCNTLPGYVVPVNTGLTCTNQLTGSSVNATQSLAGCAGNADDDVWFSFQATQTSHAVSVTPSGSMPMNDVVFQVFSGACGALASIVCVNSTVGGNPESTILTGLTIGNTYHMRVHSFGSSANAGGFTICIAIPAPPNDNCNTLPAYVVPVNTGLNCTNQLTGSSVNATQSQAGCLGNADDDVWFSFQATQTNHLVSVTPSGGAPINDVVFQVFSGACASLSSIVCVNSTIGGNPESTTLTGLTVGNTYNIRVYSFGSSANAGEFTICIAAVIPLNDNCNTLPAYVVPVNTGLTCTNQLTGTSVNATQSQPGCTGNADDDVWFSFIATTTIHVVTVTPSGTPEMNDIVFQVFSGGCGSLTSLACVDNISFGGTETTTLTGLSIGATYFMRVYDYYSNGDGGFTICITTPPPANDNCNTLPAFGVPVNTAQTCTNQLNGTSVNASQSQAGCAGTADDDVWFWFDATSTSHRVTVTPSGTPAMSDVVFQVYSGSCGSLASLECVNNTGGASPETSNFTGLTIGNRYYLRAHSAGSSGQGVFTICITTPLPNDECNTLPAFVVPVNTNGSCTNTLTGSSVGASFSMSSCSSGGQADDDVWFSFVATGANQVVTVTPTGTPAINDIVFQVFSGTCGSLTSVACVDASFTPSGPETTTLTGLSIGATYLMRVYSYGGAGSQGGFTICITPPTLPNDNCNALPDFKVPVNTGLTCTNQLSGTSVDATQSMPSCNGGNADDDVWFSFQAATTSQIVTVSPSGSPAMNDVVFQVFSGGCGSPTSLACVDATGGGLPETTTLTGLTIGATYFMRVYGYSSAGDGGFTICITTPPPANDNCTTNALFQVPVNASPTACTAQLVGTSVGATQSMPGCSGNADDDVWFWFTATLATQKVTVTPSGTPAIGDFVFEAFSGDCGSLISIACLTNLGFGSPITTNLTGLTVGASYFMRVYSAGGAGTQGVFTFCITTPLANDNCNTAPAFQVPVNSGQTCTNQIAGSTVGATSSMLGCSAGTTFTHDVWFWFQATAASHTVSVTSTSINDAVFQVFSGSCGSLTSIACVNNTSGSDPETTTLTGLTIGDTYFMRVYASGGFNNSQGGFTICCTTNLPPANDNCTTDAAFQVPINTGLTCTNQLSGTTLFATESMPGCTGTADDDVWFSFQATAASHIVTVTPDGTPPINDIVFEVFDGSCGSLAQLVCRDLTAGALPETATLTGLTPGATYFMRVHSFDAGSGQGGFTICITTPPPANDNCTADAAFQVPVNIGQTCTNQLTGSSVNATESMPTCSSAGNADDDVWFSFQATAVSHVVTVTTSGTLPISDIVFEVFSGTCGSLTSVACVDADFTPSGPETTTLTGLTVGANYFMRVYSYSGAGAQGGFNICITTPPPANDNCTIDAAYKVPVNAGTSCTANLNGNSQSATQSQAGCAGTADDDVWFWFEAGHNSQIITVTPAGSPAMNDIVFQVFSGDCGNLTPMACVDNTVGGAAESLTLFDLPIGATYFVRVYSYYAAIDAGMFSICITTPPGPPANDNACDAALIAIDGITRTYTNREATSQLNEVVPIAVNPSGCSTQSTWCVNDINNSVWFKFEAPADGNVEIESFIKAGSANSDHQLSLWEATNGCADLTTTNAASSGLAKLVAANDDKSPTYDSKLINLQCLVPGQFYFIQLDGYSGSDNGLFEMKLSNPAGNACPMLPIGTSICDAVAITASATSAGHGQWIHFRTAAGEIVASVNDKRNNLGAFTASLYDETGAERTALHEYIDRNFTINPGSSNAAILRLYVDEASLSDVGATVSTLQMTKTAQTCGPVFVGPGTFEEQDGNGPFGMEHFIDYNLSGFSTFFFHAGISALPTELKSFAATKSGGANLIEWSTAAEQNVREHIIERSADGADDWASIGSLVSKGNTLDGFNYSIEDREPLPLSYYRLRTVDFDNSEQVSQVVSVVRGNGAAQNVSVFPVPASDFVHVQFGLEREGEVKFQVIDVSARTVLNFGITAQKGPNQYKLPLHDLPAGTYLLTILTETEVFRQIRLVKN